MRTARSARKLKLIGVLESSSAEIRLSAFGLFVSIFSVIAGSLVKAAPADEYRDDIRPILEKHCYECHGPEKQKAKLNLSTFSDFEKVVEAKEVWQHVLERIQAYEMPPEGKPELGYSKQQKLMKWLRALPKPEKPDCDQIASDRNANFYKGYVMSRRLNRAEYNNTVRDLFGVERLLAMFDRGWKRSEGFVPSVRLALKAALVSPHFLFLAEPEPEEGGVQRLGALPLASKLSYFLWSSTPDEELLSLAERGQLLETNVYRQQIRRMLADPKAESLGERFALQWLDLDRLGSDVRPDPKKYPEFDLELSASMKREATTFFNYIVRNNRSLLELIDSDYTFINERLARLYGMEGISGTVFQPVKLTSPNRGGVVGMAAVHALTSYPLRTSPVLRGKWILDLTNA